MNKEILEKQSITLKNIIAKIVYTLEEVEELQEENDRALSELSSNEETF